MKKSVTAFLLVLLFACSCIAQKLQPLPAILEVLYPVNVFPENPAAGYVFSDKNKETGPSIFAVSPANAAAIISAEIFAATPSHFNIQASWKSTGDIKKGDVMLARMNVRAVYAKQESGDAVINFFTQQAAAPFERNIILELNVGPEWKTIEIPFTAISTMAAGEASVGFTFGALAQKVEITGLQLLNFQQKINMSTLPATRLTYAGRENGAAWRKEALKRLDEIGTAPLIIQVKDAKGKPMDGAIVTARLIDPEFVFGTAVAANYIASGDTTS